MIEVRFDLDEIIEAVDRAQTEIDRLAPDAMILASNIIASRAKSSHDYIDQSGVLTNSIMPQTPAKNPDGLTVEVVAGAPYADAIESGSRAHDIEPVKRKALRWPVEGGYRFAKKVRHPGTKAYKFLQNAFDASEPQLEQVFTQAIELAFDRAGF